MTEYKIYKCLHNDPRIRKIVKIIDIHICGNIDHWPVNTNPHWPQITVILQIDILVNSLVLDDIKLIYDHQKRI